MKRDKAIGATIGAIGVAALAGANQMFIDADGGGSVYGYIQKYDALQKAGTQVVVRGACYSSCTMALGYPRTCLMPDATLGFHPAYVPYLFGLAHYAVNPAATKVMRDHYPADALEVIDRHNGLRDNGGWLRPKITVVSAKEFPQRYRCEQ